MINVTITLTDAQARAIAAANGRYVEIQLNKAQKSKLAMGGGEQD